MAEDAVIIAVKHEVGGYHYEIAETVDPTCTEDGHVVYTCQCGETYTEILPATGHAYELVGVKEAACGVDGLDAF